MFKLYTNSFRHFKHRDMRRNAMSSLLLLLMLSPLFLSGCGTISTFVQEDYYYPYDGVFLDIWAICMSSDLYDCNVDAYWSPGELVIACFDLPFSFVADTLLLPYSVPMRLYTETKSRQETEEARRDSS